jgi:cellulose synthase/poly-beta-1,6-N-acetylglucosamine synthase-like glycosyltransferase
MKGCVNISPVPKKNIEILEGNYFCIKRYSKTLYEIPSPNYNYTT